MASIALCAMGTPSVGLAEERWATAPDTSQTALGQHAFSPCLYQPVGDQLCHPRLLADFDGDGRLDLLFLEQNATTKESFLRIQAGPIARDAGRDPSPAASMLLDRNLAGAQISTADVNDDGRADIVLSAPRRLQTVVIYGKPWGRWGVMGHSMTQDMIVDHSDQPTLVSSFLGRSSRAGGPSAPVSRFIDLDGDQRLDLVQAFLVADGRFSALDELHIMLAPSEWSARQSFRVDVRIRGRAACGGMLAAAADLTGDGLGDLVLRACLSGRATPHHLLIVGQRTWPAELQLLMGVGGPQVLPPERPTPGPSPSAVPFPGAGYYVSGSTGSGLLPVTDIDGDGTDDLVIPLPASGSTGNFAVFHGGSDFGRRLALGRADQVLANAGLGEMGTMQAWRLADLGPGLTSSLLLMGEDLRLFSERTARRRLVDLRRDQPSLALDLAGRSIWTAADFDGDGMDDLLLGPASTSSHLGERYPFSIHYGPLAVDEGVALKQP